MSAFFIELIIRLASKTPWIFRVIQVISSATLFITGLPLLLQSSGINLPDRWDAIASEVVSISSIVAIFVSQLAVPTNVVDSEKLKQ
jgi:hypothetical protein